MSDWVLIPCLVGLRSEFNAISPNRDKGADGSIGDTNHTSSSDHTPDEDSSVLRDHDADSKNEVHALDIDSSGPWPTETGDTQKKRFHKIVMRIIAGEKAKWNSANEVCRLEYVIWDGVIYSRSRNFVGVAYNGSDPHTNHAHFSGRYLTSAENNTQPWNVEVDVALDSADKAWIESTVGRLAADAGEVWAAEVNPGDGRRALSGVVVDLYNIGRTIRDAQAASTAQIVAAINASPAIDANEVAAVLAPQLLTGLTAALAEMDLDGGSVSAAEVEAALRGIFADAATP